MRGQINPSALLALAIVIVVIIIIFATVTIPVQDTVTEYTSQPYSYEQTQIRSVQVRPFPWINEVTQVQFIVTNTDTQEGTFSLNFIFDNGTQVGNKQQTVDILPGQGAPVTQNSPLSGVSTTKLEVTTPNKEIPHQVTVTRNEHIWVWAWDAFWRLIRL